MINKTEFYSQVDFVIFLTLNILSSAGLNVELSPAGDELIDVFSGRFLQLRSRSGSSRHEFEPDVCCH